MLVVGRKVSDQASEKARNALEYVFIGNSARPGKTCRRGFESLSPHRSISVTEMHIV